MTSFSPTTTKHPRILCNLRSPDDVDWGSDELESTRRNDEPDAQLETEPGVADALRVEERAV